MNRNKHCQGAWVLDGSCFLRPFRRDLILTWGPRRIFNSWGERRH